MTGGKYGDAIAAPITQALAPYIAPRINDDKFEGKRLEVVRLPFAAGQKYVRLCLVQLGAGSWYFGVDNIAFYDIPQSGAVIPPGTVTVGSPQITGITLSSTQITVKWQGGTLQSTPTLTNPTWTPMGKSGAYSEAVSGNKFFRVQQ